MLLGRPKIIRCCSCKGNQSVPFLVMVHTENALVNLTGPVTLETINATEGDNVNIACFALDSLYNFAYLNYSG
ncbi:hypothetical protein Anas_11493, partial [Armadillidium nasatum]